jgi:Arc/MetJ-type ribon-helix-helix transcriptional regulator
MREPKVTVKIPRPLYERIQQVIAESGFSSPTDFIVFVLRDLVGDSALQKSGTHAQAAASDKSGAQSASSHSPDGTTHSFSNEEIAEIRRKLHNLGYL